MSKELILIEFSGSARSGKGSIVDYIPQVEPRVAREETGADYRLVTKHLLEDHVIEPDMTRDNVRAEVSVIGVGGLAKIIEQRSELIAKYNKALHDDDSVNRFVSIVGSVPDVRTAVKEGLKRRVLDIRDDDKYDVLLMDGRNLGAVVKNLPGVKLLLRVFASCSNLEATVRECARLGIDIYSEKGLSKYNGIKERNHEDASRELDPVRPEQEAISYWKNDNFRQRSDELAGSLENGRPWSEIVDTYLDTHNQATPLKQEGVVRDAVSAHRQLLLDTTPFRLFEDPKSAMLKNSVDIYRDAVKLH